MTKCLFEYIWLDGYSTKNLRSKVKVLEADPALEDYPVSTLPIWNFDGSSTEQAPGEASECLLKPARVYQCRINQRKS